MENSGPTDSNWNGTEVLRKVENQLLRHLELVLLRKEPISIKLLCLYQFTTSKAQTWPAIFLISKQISKKQTEEIQTSSWIINSHSLFLIFQCMNLSFTTRYSPQLFFSGLISV